MGLEVGTRLLDNLALVPVFVDSVLLFADRKKLDSASPERLATEIFSDMVGRPANTSPRRILGVGWERLTRDRGMLWIWPWNGPRQRPWRSGSRGQVSKPSICRLAPTSWMRASELRSSPFVASFQTFHPSRSSWSSRSRLVMLRPEGRRPLIPRTVKLERSLPYLLRPSLLRTELMRRGPPLWTSLGM